VQVQEGSAQRKLRGDSPASEKPNEEDGEPAEHHLSLVPAIQFRFVRPPSPLRIHKSTRPSLLASPSRVPLCPGVLIRVNQGASNPACRPRCSSVAATVCIIADAVHRTLRRSGIARIPLAIDVKSLTTRVARPARCTLCVLSRPLPREATSSPVLQGRACWQVVGMHRKTHRQRETSSADKTKSLLSWRTRFSTLRSFAPFVEVALSSSRPRMLLSRVIKRDAGAESNSKVARRTVHDKSLRDLRDAG